MRRATRSRIGPPRLRSAPEPLPARAVAGACQYTPSAAAPARVAVACASDRVSRRELAAATPSKRVCRCFARCPVDRTSSSGLGDGPLCCFTRLRASLLDPSRAQPLVSKPHPVAAKGVGADALTANRKSRQTSSFRPPSQSPCRDCVLDQCRDENRLISRFGKRTERIV